MYFGTNFGAIYHAQKQGSKGGKKKEYPKHHYTAGEIFGGIGLAVVVVGIIAAILFFI